MRSKLVATLAALSLASGLAPAVADDGAALYKAKCAVCHGANGEGKPAMQAPAIKDTKLEVQQIVDHLMKGEPTSKPPHVKGISGLNEGQATAIAEYVKTLK
ncbi:MAG TPA: cytochrome c [Terriglobales bacterium]|nr:cytochrome c [Terriglobales bacterium]